MAVSDLYQGIGNENMQATGNLTTRPRVSFGSDKYAQENRAWLSREQWKDYQQRFQPYEDKLIDAVTGSEMLDERLGAISINNKKAFEASANNANQMRSRYGIVQNDAQNTNNQNNQNLAMAKANANAMNQTRTHVYDRNMSAIGGGGSRQAAVGGL